MIKLITANLIAAMANILYWGFSEVYIHNGLLINGLVKGFAVCFLCVLLGVVIGELIIKVVKV